MSVNCPICSKDDEVRKLSVIVADGRASGTFSGPTGGVTYSDHKWGVMGGYSSMSGSMKTELAQRLSPPEEPKKYGGSCGQVVAILVVGLVGVIGGILALGQNPVGPILLVGGLVGIFVVAFSIDKRNKQKYKAELPRWNKAMSKWDQLYFCFRDGVIINPITNETCKLDELMKYLYS